MPETVRYAGFWLRFWATAIDVVLLTVIIAPLLLWIYGLDRPDAQHFVLFRGPMDFLIQVVLPGVAAIIFWKCKSATPGKMLLSLKIVDARTGGGLSLGQCVGRYFAYLVSTIPFCLGFLWIAFDNRKQAWHDKLAGTVVVRAGKKPDETDAAV